MNFDIISMKQRAKELLKTTKPSVMISSIIYILFTMAYIIGTILMFGYEVKLWYVYFIIMGLIHIILRSGFKLYGLNVAKEEKTKISDIFSAFKDKPLNMLLSGIVRDICYAVGFVLLFAGIVFPFYWFRFSVYIMKDEEVGIFEAFKRSRELLKGHYMELIKIDASNLLWCLLWYFTFGIAGIYVKPFFSILYAEYYEHLKAQNELLG